LTLTED